MSDKVEIRVAQSAIEKNALAKATISSRYGR